LHYSKTQNRRLHFFPVSVSPILHLLDLGHAKAAAQSLQNRRLSLLQGPVLSCHLQGPLLSAPLAPPLERLEPYRLLPGPFLRPDPSMNECHFGFLPYTMLYQKAFVLRQPVHDAPERFREKKNLQE
jgi:hypothetical protein